MALDLTTIDEQGRPWDFSKKNVKKKVRALLEEQDPDLLVGIPMCTMHSSWQRFNELKEDGASGSECGLLGNATSSCASFTAMKRRGEAFSLRALS